MRKKDKTDVRKILKKHDLAVLLDAIIIISGMPLMGLGYLFLRVMNGYEVIPSILWGFLIVGGSTWLLLSRILKGS